MDTDHYAPSFQGAYCPDCHGPLSIAQFEDETGYNQVYLCTFRCQYTYDGIEPGEPPVWLNLG